MLHQLEDWGTATAVLRGDLDITTVPEARRSVQAAEADADRLIVDLRSVGFLDSAGVNLVFDIALRARRRGSRITLLASDPQVRRVLRMTFIDEVADVEPPLGPAEDRDGPTVLPL